jgi:hypothetical protein
MSDTRQQITAWIEEDIVQDIQELANVEGRSFSNMVEQLCKRQIHLTSKPEQMPRPAEQ